MSWKSMGYEVRRYANRKGTGWDYVARTPATELLYSGPNFEKAKAYCIEHFIQGKGLPNNSSRIQSLPITLDNL